CPPWTPCHSSGATFSPGIHYIGERTVTDDDTWLTAKMIAIAGDPEYPISWHKMGYENEDTHERDGTGKGAYDVIKIADQPLVRLRAGTDEYEKELCRHFPGKERAVSEWIKTVKEAAAETMVFLVSRAWTPTVQRIWRALLGRNGFKWAGKTTHEVIASLGFSAREEQILCGQHGTTGEAPRDLCFLLHAWVVHHFINGGYFPVGGPMSIVKTLSSTIHKAGGRVFVRAHVERIPVENGEAVGVVLANGDTIKSRMGVISAAGLSATLHHLLSPADVERYMAAEMKFLRQVGGGVSCVCGFVGINGTAEELKLPSSNLWGFPEEATEGHDMDEIIMKYRNNLLDFSVEDGFCFISFLSARDPAYTHLHPDTTSCFIAAEAAPEAYEQLNEALGGAHTERRTKAYKNTKKQLETKLKNLLLKHFPQLEGRITSFDVSTPLSMYHYLKRFASYGLRQTPERFTHTLPRVGTAIRKFYLTGEDLVSGGFIAAVASAMVTATHVLGYTPLDILTGHHLLNDLPNVPQPPTLEQLTQAAKTEAM
ncbi:unnamed protein product, partial [Vitrella brassicaformis CCMP3155]